MAFFQAFWRALWQRRASWWRSLLLYPCALVRAWVEEGVDERARALVYMTLLTLVPLLAVAFALLRGFGVEGVIEPWLAKLFSPMGEAGAQVVGHLLHFVNQARAGSLGIVGVVFLFVSVIGLAQNIEAALNRIWAVDSERRIHVRITGYLTAILLAPLVIGALMSVMFGLRDAAWLQPYLQTPGLRLLIGAVMRIVPAAMVFFVLAAVYVWIPNCRVQWRPAMAGAAFFLVLWFPVSWLFATFIAGSTNYPAIYSGLASIVILLIWLNFLWLLFLMGAKVAMLVQRPQERSPFADPHWHGDEQIATAMALMTAVANAFRRGEAPGDAEALAAEIQASPRKVSLLLNTLARAGLVNATGDHPPRYLPSRAVKHYTLRDIYDALAPQESRLIIARNSRYLGVYERYVDMLDKPLLHHDR